MKINLSNFKPLVACTLGYCLKIRHLILQLVILTILSISCGKVINQKKDMNTFNKNVSFLMMESQCVNQISSESNISKSIRELYQATIEKFPQEFLFINPRYYDYKNPLILSLESMNQTYQSFKTFNSKDINSKNAEDLYYLFNGSRRFDDQKCSLENLTAKKKSDIRPYLYIANNSEVNSMEENAIELCSSFFNSVKCKAEFLINKQNKTLASMVKRYYDRFELERYLPLFKLRTVHQKYSCQNLVQNGEGDKVVMTIKVFSTSFSHEWLVELLSHVEETWSSSSFSLKLNLVNSYSNDAVILVPTNKGISYVPDNNNRMVYLSTVNDQMITKRVLDHEFGHVLGFPDCYIEFFDDSKKELVYYEISKSNTNIMCSLKEGVHVQADYFTQLIQNSCLFN